LVEAVRRGQIDSLGELYRRHYAGMVGLAFCVLSDRHLAEDAAQESFAVACRDLGRLRRADKFARWLGGICRRVAKGVARARRRETSSQGVADPAGTRSDDDRVEAVRRSVGQLPGTAREVVLLRYFSGLSHAQISATLGISPQAVHGRLIRARRKVAEDLRRNGLDRSAS
jgi:RNA polymerase sigma-70 factor (ECF subfamily)